MGHATNPQAGTDHDHGGGHGHAPHAHEEVETPEMKAEREASALVQGAMARSLARRIAPVMVLGGAGVSLALLSTLGGSAPPQTWLWLLPSILVTGWGLSLRKVD